MSKVPFLDLEGINRRHEDEYHAALHRVLNSEHYILGDEVKAFEQEFASYCGVDYCVGVGNGMDALTITLLALGLKKGDEVIVPANTFIASFLAITNAGCTPVAVDPDPSSMLISPDNIHKALTKKTKAIMPVHLYGNVCAMNEISIIAENNGLYVVEDAAQAHGATYNDHIVGGLSDMAGFSFYPGKNLGAIGDGGAITTNNISLFKNAQIIRNYGSSRKYLHEYKGLNSRLDEIQAAFLRSKLKVLEKDNKHRSFIASRYLSEIKNSKIRLPSLESNVKSAWHLFVVQADDRDHFQEYLAKKGIETLIHYPIPCIQQDCYSDLIFNTCPVSESLAECVISLPISPVMPHADVDQVVDAVNKW